MQLKVIAFDFGDTIVLTDKWNYDKCLMRLLENLHHNKICLNVSFEEFKRVYFDVRNHVYLESEESLREVDFRFRLSKTLERFKLNYFYDSKYVTNAVDAFIGAFIEDARIDKNTPDLLSSLKQNFKLGLISNFAYSKGFWQVLRYFNLEKFFNSIVVSADVGFRKPHKKMFKTSLDKLRVKPSQALFVGDSLKADIHGAKQIGMRTVLVENIGIRKNPWALAGELDPFPIKPDFKIPNLNQLEGILEQLR